MGTRLSASFRDPAGHVFLHNGSVHRHIETVGLASYRALMDSGLYAALIADGTLIEHEDLGPVAMAPGAATVIRPVQIPMVSYPYEWCVSQLRDAALVTLKAQRTALRFNMVLKDASAYNVQFLRGRPVLIDTLSFEPYAGGPWVAYRQFCQHFYAPMLLAGTRDPRLARMAAIFIDGVPLPIASRLLPRRSYLRPGALFHIHLHAAGERRWADARRGTASAVSGTPSPVTSLPPTNTRDVMALVDSLERAVLNVRWTARSQWSSYYEDRTSYSSDEFARKSAVVTRWLEQLRPGVVWDMGANTGHFSKAADRVGAMAVAFDSDPACVETLYREVREQHVEQILPLVLDLANPSPAIGWANNERLTLEGRGPVDLVLALALIHHLAIGNNVPLPAVAEYLGRLGRRAIVEFVPKADPMVRQMISGRSDVFSDYNEEAFEHACTRTFHIDERLSLGPSNRTLYLMTTR